jgi:hypothetical protein
VRRVETWGLRAVGILLMLLGLALFLSPRFAYTQRESIPHTAYRVKREKVILVPRPIALLIAGAGVLTLLATRR